MRRNAFWMAAVAAVLLVLPAVAIAAVGVTRAELNAGELRLEGSGAGATVVVRSPESIASRAADGSGAFRIEASSFRASTCRVTVSDGSTSTEASLAGCTPATEPTPTPTPTPSPTPAPTTSTLQITAEQFLAGYVGTDYTVFPTSTGAKGGEPVRFRVIAGRLPGGLSLTSSFGVASAVISGRPTTVGSSTFTLEASDAADQRAQRTFTIRVDPARPVVITNQSDALAPGTIGESYAIGVFADGGVSPYRWSRVAGTLPPGLQLTSSPGRITGTPTTRGTFSFALRATDSAGAFTERTFSITVD
jgi:hypothetical protein